MRIPTLKTLLIISWLWLGPASAQAPQSVRSSLQLLLDIEDQIGMEVLQPGASIELSHFGEGRQTASIVLDKQFIIASNLPYSITVTASKAFLISKTGQIPISAVAMTVVGTAAAEWASAITSLSTRPQPLALRAPPTNNQPFSILYRLKPDRRVRNPDAGIYAASLTFTMTQD